MNRIAITCTLALLGLLAAACESAPPCPEGFTYDHDRRVCVFTGDAGSPVVDAGQPATDAGQPEEDAGDDVDAGDLDAGDEADAAVTDAAVADAGGDAD